MIIMSIINLVIEREAMRGSDDRIARMNERVREIGRDDGSRHSADTQSRW